MVNGWVIPVAFAVIAIVAVLAMRATGTPRRPAWVANSAGLQSDKVVKAAVYQYNLLRTIGAIAVFLSVLASSMIMARPFTTEIEVDKTGTRDLVLCLDVSGSMVDYDTEIVEKFSELLQYMNGERLALVIFNSTARVVFPLTDDYDMVATELDIAAKALSPTSKYSEWWDLVAGTEGVPNEASLIPDGLASCALQFDTQPTERSRTILFATDNDVYGRPILNLAEATDVVIERDAIIIGLFVGDPNDSDPYNAQIAQEFITQTDRSGGFTLLMSDPKSTEAIIDSITSQQIVDVDTPPRTLMHDQTMGWLILATLGVMLLIVVGAVVRE